MIETFEKEINGRIFKVREFDGETALEIVTDMLQMVAPALASASKGFNQDKSVLEQDLDVTGIVQNLASSLHTPKVKALVKRILSNTTLEDQRENGTFPVNVSKDFNQVFTARTLLKDLPPLLGFIIKENFGGFSGLTAYIGGIGSGQQTAK